MLREKKETLMLYVSLDICVGALAKEEDSESYSFGNQLFDW